MYPSSLCPRRARARLLALLLLVLASLPGTTHLAHAQNNIIYVNDNATGADDGSNWANAFTSFQTALSAATSGKEIWVAAGNYTPGDTKAATFQLKNGVAIYGGFAGSETSREPRDWIANTSFLDGRYDPENAVYHVVTGYELNSTAVLDGFTILQGNAIGPVSDCPASCGGGIYLVTSSPTLSNLIITRNQALYGAGMVNNDRSNPTLTNVSFISNTTYSDGWGGGMYNYKSSPTLTDVLFSGNLADDNGGGMANYVDNSPTLTNVIFSGNKVNQQGGGMYNEESDPTLTNVTFSGNRADISGGMYNINSDPMLINVTFSGNRARIAGGMNSFYRSPTLVNVTFSGNHADEEAGGMLNEINEPTLVNVTFSGNHATEGGGMYNYSSSPLIQNSIIWGNSASSGANFYQDGVGGTTTIRFSLVEGGLPDLSTDGGNNRFGDPHFVRAVNCGADGCGDDPTEPGNESLDDDYGDLRLAPSSPALDVGDNGADLNGANPGNATIASIDFDPNGAPRIAAVKQLSPKVDMGAYERVNTVSAQAGGPYTAIEGAPIALNGAASSDEVEITNYAWDCTNNGSAEATSTSPTGSSCTYADDGTFTLGLTVTDLIGLSGSATAAVTIANVVPTLTDLPDQSTNAATAKSFTLGSFADPGDDAPWQVVVDWGDNTPTSQVNATSAGVLPATPHTYAQAGTYNVVVTISDDGGSGTGGFQVAVNPPPPGAPSVTAPADQTATANGAQSFALGSFTDPGSNGPWQVSVNWGDGSAATLFSATSAGALGTKPHTYAAAGTYDALVTVSDGALATSASFRVTVSGGSSDAGSVAGVVFADANANGTQESDEPGVAGAGLTLQSVGQVSAAGAALTVSASSDSNGRYRFDNVPPGSYTLVLMPISGYVILGASEVAVTVQTGQTTTTPNFTLQLDVSGGDGSTLHLPTVERP